MCLQQTAVCLQVMRHSVPAGGDMVMTSDVTSSSAASVVATRPRTLQMQSAEKRLTQALDNLRSSTPGAAVCREISAA